MGDELEERLEAVDQATLTPLVRRTLENERVSVVGWSYQPVERGLGRSYGVYRFQGEAQAEGETLGWSLILKAIGPATGSQKPSAGDYWKREALAYQSGLLDDLQGDLIAPRCVGLVEHPGQECWLWLEDAAASRRGPSSFAQCRWSGAGCRQESLPPQLGRGGPRVDRRPGLILIAQQPGQ